MTDLNYIKARAGKEGYRAENVEIEFEDKLAELVYYNAVSGDIEDIHQQLDLYLDTTLQLLDQTDSDATNSQDLLYRFWLHCLKQHFIFDVEDSITSDTHTQLYFKRFKNSLKPIPKITVSEWADKNRMLPQKASAEPGPWRTARTPYLKEIMDLLSADNETKHVVFMKGAQVGGTESGNNWIGYTIHHAPCTMMMVLPTLETAKRTSKHRIAPMIEDTPVLDELVKDSRSRDAGNTILNKEFPNGTLIITGANSAVGLRSTPAKYLFMDEIDGYESDIDGEGDPVNLAIKRTSTFSKNRKILMVSTPTMKGVSRIEKAFEESDQRKYHVPCPVCKQMQPIAWSRLKWNKDDHNVVELQCIECEALISENKKTWMLENGQWIAEDNSKQNIAGFHLSSLYSPLGWYSWSDAVKDYLAAKDDPALLKTWVNTVLGETYEDESTHVKARDCCR